jgi:hypothetical protein
VAIGSLLGGRTAFVTTRPCRAPHHTISEVGLIGGGPMPMPGEVSLAHNGVRFLDALPECRRHVLAVLQQPLKDGVIDIRSRGLNRAARVCGLRGMGNGREALEPSTLAFHRSCSGVGSVPPTSGHAGAKWSRARECTPHAALCPSILGGIIAFSHHASV